MITLHSKNYKIFQNFGFPKMGGIPTPIKNLPTTYEVAKIGFEISSMYIFKKNKKLPYLLDVQVAELYINYI